MVAECLSRVPQTSGAVMLRPLPLSPLVTQVSPACLHRGCPVPLACGRLRLGPPRASHLPIRALDLGQTVNKEQSSGIQGSGRHGGDRHCWSPDGPLPVAAWPQGAHEVPLCPGLCLGVSAAQAPGAERPAAGGSCGRVSTLSHADCRSNSDMAHILVQSHAHRPGEGCGAVPFSWRIRDYVEELWVQARYISEAAGARAGGAASGREVSAALRAQGLRRAGRPGPPEPPAPGCAVTRRGVGRQRSRKTSIS